MKNKSQSIENSYSFIIIEDSKIHQEWLKLELSSNKKIKILSTNPLGREGIASAKQYKVDMVLLDFQLQDMTGIEVSRRIKSYNPKIKIFSLTAHTEISIIERMISDKNVDAIAIKGSPYFEANFLPAIMHVINGGTYLDPSLLIKIRESKNLKGLNELTKREFEIFIQSYSGKSDNKIAADLCIELPHVRNLKSRIAKKIKDTNIDKLITHLLKNSCPD